MARSEGSQPSPFEQVKPGDTVVRMLAGAPMQLAVTEVDDRFIYCGPDAVGWKFDRQTGMEVDEELGWGPEFGITGSYLVPPGEVDADASGASANREPASVPDFVRFRTATGSRYEVDNREMVWRRLSATLASGRLRSDSGRLLMRVDPTVGVSTLLVCEPFAPGLGSRVVMTTPVVAIEEVRPAATRSPRQAGAARRGRRPGPS
jgi:hypothetical protein